MTTCTEHMHERLAALHERIAAARQRAGTGAAVTLVAVSKRQPAAAVAAAYAAGQRHFGENYVQEGVAKQAGLDAPEAVWHHIGPIQSNKCADIAAHFAWAQGVDRPRVAQRLARHATAEAPLQVCVQVNISGEASKSGVAPAGAAALCELVATLPALRLRGLMTIPEAGADETATRRAFEAMHRLYEDLRAQGHALDTLSMGMSDDFETAIAHGATMVRVGTALFGPRR